MIFTGRAEGISGATAAQIPASNSMTSLQSVAGACSARGDHKLISPEAVFMARRLLILLALIFPFSNSAWAQKFDLFGGYSYEHLDSSPGRNLNGLEITGQYKFQSWLGLAADLDAHFGLPSEPDARTLHFMAGPQLSFPTRIAPFVHVLGGFGHVNLNGSGDTSVAAAIGGGIDMRLVPLVSWRIIQGDEVFSHFFSTTQHDARLSTGLVFRF
jgi:hypothetical protein